MSHFLDYSEYYNLLYKDKNYSVEVDYIDSLIKQFRPSTTSILDVGCGTGRHAKLLTEKGYSVHGVDLSWQMLEIARLSETTELTFSQGDIRSFRLNKRFDAITSLFHVMSYQTTNEDVVKSLLTIREHLNDDGIFVFDCWYGPAVLLDLPGIRVKEIEDEHLKVIRVSRPKVDFNKSIVDVSFEVNVFDKTSRSLQTIHENHEMRYFFLPELDYFAKQLGFRTIDSHSWLSSKPIDQSSWYITVILQKAK